MGDDKLKVIAAELITQVRKSVTIDWTLREGARAKIPVTVKRILNKYGSPPTRRNLPACHGRGRMCLARHSWAQGPLLGAEVVQQNAEPSET